MQKIGGFFYRFLGSNILVGIIYNTFLVYYLWDIVVKFHSVYLAGLIATISLAASLATSIPIGQFIDRANSTLVSLFASILTVAGISLLFLGGSLALIYGTAALVSVGYTMKGDSFSATTKKHLPEEQYAYGNSLSQGGLYASLLIGTALGGVSILYLTHYFALILVLLSVTSMLSSFPIKEINVRDTESTALKEVASAIGFYKKILGFIAVAFVLNGLFESLDVYSSGLFHIVLKASPVYYTVFIAIISLGAMAGAGMTNFIKKWTSSPTVISILILCYAPLLLLLGISKSPVADIVNGFVLGVLITVVSVPLQTKLMKIIPRNIYGKVMAFLRVFLAGATPAMAALLSFVAIFVRVDVVIFYLGIIMFPVASLSFLVLPKFMNIIEDPSKDETKGAQVAK